MRSKGGVPSQFFRRAFADVFQKDSEKLFWDWKSKKSVKESVDFRNKVVSDALDLFKDKKALKNLYQKKLALVKDS